MIKKWYNTNAAQAAGMIEVDDEFILSLSNGEVNFVDLGDDEVEITKNSIYDSKIFGNLLFGEDRKNNEDSMKMGHIKLTVPIVNVQYYRGRKPILASLLKLSMKELDSIIYYSKYIIVDAGNTSLKYKQILSDEELKNAKEQHKDSFTALTGAEAIDYFLKKGHVPERKNIILHTLPVLPLSMRYIYDSGEEGPCKQEKYIPTSLNGLYERVINRNNRYQRLKELDAPEIIIRNEARILQEYVDALINNGVRGYIVTCAFDNIPRESLDDLYDCITRISTKAHPNLKARIETDKFIAAINNYWDYYDANEMEGEIIEDDDPRIIKLNELEEEIKNIVKPFILAYIQTNYKRYESFSDTIFNYVTMNFVQNTYGWTDLNEDGQDACKVFEKGFTRQIDLYIKKQLKWAA